MKKTYLTVLSTNNYLLGVLTLYKSLKATGTSYPFAVLVSSEITDNVKNILLANGIKVIESKEKKKISLPEEIENKNKKNKFSHWNNTLDKLKIFDLVEFDKIVFLDSDMLVLKNIDELFEKPHMSATVAGKSYPGNNWTKLNSGVMVIEPVKNLTSKILEKLPEAIKSRELIGDQDLIQEYYNNWENSKELELDEKYNIFITYVDYYVKKLNYNDIKIIHYIGSDKPWLLNKLQYLKKYFKKIIKRKTIEIKYLNLYNEILKEVIKDLC